MTPEAFVAKWRAVSVTERSASQTHFNELCDLLGVEKPLDADPAGEFYAFERHVSKAAGGKGFADVWKRDCFAWEYKGKRKNLSDAYLQLLLYRDDLANPPLLIVSDIERIEIHTNFTGTNKRVYTITLEDLLDPEKRELLRKAFTDPGTLNPQHQREAITQEATAWIGDIALKLRDRSNDPQTVAHFMMQLVFALFAEDVELLPDHLLSDILKQTKNNPERAQTYLSQLFQAMATGGEVLLKDVPFFNGGLFQHESALALTQEELNLLHQAARLDWSEVEPAIFGTLFERSLDPEKRSQLGAHYTSRADILRIVQPVIIEPLRLEWTAVREDVEKRLKRGHKKKAAELVGTFLQKLHNLRVLDPACGSGNFLYVAMQQLKELEKEVTVLAQNVGAPSMAFVGPKQFYGLELNVFAQELASIVVWIGYLQWSLANGPGNVQSPILEKLDNIRLHDALMNDDGTEYQWPAADFIIGNPPFLGSQLMRAELGGDYVRDLRQLYSLRIPGQSDFVCYWFEKAREAIEHGQAKRAGLLATNSISGGANRTVLDRIKSSGGIFVAWSDEPWILEGAAVRVSLIGFDDGTQTDVCLDGKAVPQINADLTAGINLRAARRLHENQGIAFQGPVKVGAFDIPGDTARGWLGLPNPSGVSNADVLRPWTNGMDIMQRNSNRWIIDFDSMEANVAAQYIVPFEYLRTEVKPKRDLNRDAQRRMFWWRLGRSGEQLKTATAGLTRFICTPRVSKHRVFIWVDSGTLPDSATVAVASGVNSIFGVLHSHAHEVWSLRMGTRLGVGNDPRYTPTSCFETFPFPRPTSEQREAIASWAKHLNEVRQGILTGHEKLTMTKLYNELDELRQHRDSNHRTYPLLVAHEKLDEAVAAAYGWDWPLESEKILKRLLELNLQRAAEEASEADAARER